MTTTKKVLLLGLTAVVVDDAQQQLRMPDVELLSGTGIDDVRSALAGRIDHVIMGAGIDLETRLDIVRELPKTATEKVQTRLLVRSFDPSSPRVFARPG